MVQTVGLWLMRHTSFLGQRHHTQTGYGHLAQRTGVLGVQLRIQRGYPPCGVSQQQATGLQPQ